MIIAHQHRIEDSGFALKQEHLAAHRNDVQVNARFLTARDAIGQGVAPWIQWAQDTPTSP